MLGIRSRGLLQRAGFTLAEILVALAIMAILTAIALPALNSQLRRSDSARLANDLVAVQTAVQAFIADVHRAPSVVTQLTTRITTSPTSFDLANPVAAAIPDYLVAAWRGPYLTRDVLTATGPGTIQSAFTVTTVGVVGSQSDYLTVTVTNVSAREFAGLEEMLDEGTATGTSSTAGAIRYMAASSTLLFLAVPLI